MLRDNDVEKSYATLVLDQLCSRGGVSQNAYDLAKGAICVKICINPALWLDRVEDVFDAISAVRALHRPRMVFFEMMVEILQCANSANGYQDVHVEDLSEMILMQSYLSD